MQWVIDNWILLALGGGMVAMHLFGHGGHGGHGKSRRHDHDDATDRQPKSKPDPKKISTTVIPKVGSENSTKAASNNSKTREKPDDH